MCFRSRSALCCVDEWMEYALGLGLSRRMEINSLCTSGGLPGWNRICWLNQFVNLLTLVCTTSLYYFQSKGRSITRHREHFFFSLIYQSWNFLTSHSSQYPRGCRGSRRRHQGIRADSWAAEAAPPNSSCRDPQSRRWRRTDFLVMAVHSGRYGTDGGVEC